MPSPLVQQVLVVQTQNGVNMVSGTTTTAPSTAGTIEPIVPIGAQLGAQDTPSVIQGARPVVSTEQTMQSTQRYGTLPYCRIRHPCRTLPCLLVRKAFFPNGLLWFRAISSFLCLTPIGCL